MEKSVRNIKTYKFQDKYALREVLNNFIDKGEDSEYSVEQIIKIFTDKDNMLLLIDKNLYYFGEDFSKLLNLNIKEISDAYLSEWFIKTIIDKGCYELNDFFRGIHYEDFIYNGRDVYLNKLLFGEVVKETIDDYECFLNNGSEKMEFTYNEYFSAIRRLEDEENKKDLYFEILDNLLINEVFNGFEEATNFIFIKEEVLKEYFDSRRDLVTKIINESNSRMLGRIFSNLGEGDLDREMFPERERIVNHLDWSSFYNFFISYKRLTDYKFDCNNINVDNVVEALKGDTYGLPKALSRYIDNENIVEEIYRKTLEHEEIIESTMKKLNDTKKQYNAYMCVLKNSSYYDSLSDKNREFVEDMRELVLREEYKRALELNEKYKDVGLEEVKLRILEDVKNKSRESIISSLTDLSCFDKHIESYKFGDKVYKIPTIIFDGQPYNFLVRAAFLRDYDNEKDCNQLKCYSTICEENRSTYRGDIKVKFGYSNIKPWEIEYVFPYDAICNNFEDMKYWPKGLRTPTWITAEELNRRARENCCYDELRIRGYHLPDFVVSYDEVDEQSALAANMFKASMVKILRKSYPNSFEDNTDPYAHWK